MLPTCACASLLAAARASCWLARSAAMAASCSALAEDSDASA